MPPASRLVRAIAAAHGDRLAKLYEHMRDGGDFSPDAKAAGRARPCAMRRLRYLTAADDEAAAGWPTPITAPPPT